MQIIAINIQKFLLDKIEEFMFREECNSRSDFVRKAIREYLQEYDWDSIDSYEQIITFNLDHPVVKKLDELMQKRVTCSRSEFIRAAVLNKIMKIEKQIEEEKKQKAEMEKFKPKSFIQDETEIIQIPIAPEIYKTYKVIKK